MTSSHPMWDLGKLSQLFKSAGAIALKYFDSPPTELKSDQTVVTLADKEIEQLFAAVLDDPANDSYMIGEETIGKYPQSYIDNALKSSCCWVLDPIDGTAPYSSHMDFWGISLGLMKNGVLVEGAVYLPRFDRLIATCGNELIYCNLHDSAGWKKFNSTANPLGVKGHLSLGQYTTRKWVYNGKNTLFSVCSCVGSLYLLLTGKVAAYCGDFKLWDIAGMLPILERANFAILSVENGNLPLSGNLADNMFELQKAERMWRVKAPVIAAADKDTALTILKNFHNTEKPCGV